MTNQNPNHPAFTAGGPSGASFGPTPQPAYPQPPQPIPTAPHTPEPPKARRKLAGFVAVAMLSAGIGGGAAVAANHYLAPGSAASSSTAVSTQVVQASSDSPDWAATTAAVKNAVVAIQVTGRNGSGDGSGVVIDAEGHIVTNNHVVAGGGEGAKLTVTIGDQAYSAQIVGTDPSTDLAVIKIDNPPSQLTVATWGDSSSLSVGQPVMAIGNPLGLSDTVTTGIVSALNRPVTTQAVSNSVDDQGSGVVVTSAIQTNAAINPGNSGGALVDASGNLIGITSSIASLPSNASSSQSGNIGIGFAIPASQAKYVAEQLIATGTVQHAQLGINAGDGNEGSQLGATVENVNAGSAAEAAGLKTGDLITSLNGQAVVNARSLIALVRNSEVGQEVTLDVIRGGETLQVKAILGAAAE
ncbi:MAG: trypsin-like peptidase domain-containing protein [Propionibacteriaceae bacterium]|nr:trypsin-like peptidase domain-containing protein [Propionibacteriaceae bacterium]